MTFKDEVSSDRRIIGIPVSSIPSNNTVPQFNSTTSKFDFNVVSAVPVGTAQGDIIYWNGTVWTLLAKGTANQLLQTGTTPSWVTRLAMTAGVATGDILYFDGTNWVILAKDTGKILQSGNAPSWVVNSPSALTMSGQTAGDILYFDGTNWVRLAKPTGTKYLQGGTTPVYSEISALTMSGQTSGDILYFDGTNWVRLAKGTAGQILQTGTPPSWIAPPAGAVTLSEQSAVSTGAFSDNTNAFVDVTGITLTMPTRTGGKAMITCEGVFRNNTLGDYAYVRLLVDGVEKAVVATISPTSNTSYFPFSLSCIAPLTGVIVKLQASSDGGTVSLPYSAGLLVTKLRSLEIS